MRLRRVLLLSRQRSHDSIGEAVAAVDQRDGAIVTVVSVVVGRGETLRRIGGFGHTMLSPNMFRDVVFVGVDGRTGGTLILAGTVRLRNNVHPKTLNLPEKKKG